MPHPSSLRRSWVLAPAAALLLALSGCSGDDAAAGDFAESYRQVSDTYRDETTAIQERAALVSGQGVDRILGVYEEILATTRAARDEFAELEAPDDFEATFDEVREVMDRQVDALSELVAAAEARDIPEVTSAASRLTELRSDWESLQQEMQELFAACGEPCD